MKNEQSDELVSEFVGGVKLTLLADGSVLIKNFADVRLTSDGVQYIFPNRTKFLTPFREWQLRQWERFRPLAENETRIGDRGPTATMSISYDPPGVALTTASGGCVHVITPDMLEADDAHPERLAFYRKHSEGPVGGAIESLRARGFSVVGHGITPYNDDSICPYVDVDIPRRVDALDIALTTLATWVSTECGAHATRVTRLESTETTLRYRITSEGLTGDSPTKSQTGV